MAYQSDGPTHQMHGCGTSSVQDHGPATILNGVGTVNGVHDNKLQEHRCSNSQWCTSSSSTSVALQVDGSASRSVELGMQADEVLRAVAVQYSDPSKYEMDFSPQPSDHSKYSFHTCISQESALKQVIQASTTRDDPLARRTSPLSNGSTRSLSTIASSLAGRGAADDLLYAEIPTISSCPANLGSGAGDRSSSKSSAPARSQSCSYVSESDSRVCANRRLEDSDLPEMTATLSALSTSSGCSTVGRHRSTGSSFFRRSQSTSAYRHPSKRRNLRGVQNKNMPKDFLWISDLLEMIVKNEAKNKGSMDRASSHAQATSPLFVVCGACPSWGVPMQAIMYSAVGQGVSAIDFWWIKPVKGSPDVLEHQTLSRWCKGPYKNDPGRSKPIYKPIGDLFVSNPGSRQIKQDFRFAIDVVSGTQRAFIEDARGNPQVPSRYYLYFVWQEEWTSNPLASNKYIRGKIAYQREPQDGGDAHIFLREYCIHNGKMDLAEHEEPTPPNTLLPNETLKQLGSMKGKP